MESNPLQILIASLAIRREEEMHRPSNATSPHPAAHAVAGMVFGLGWFYAAVGNQNEN